MLSIVVASCVEKKYNLVFPLVLSPPNEDFFGKEQIYFLQQFVRLSVAVSLFGDFCKMRKFWPPSFAIQSHLRLTFNWRSPAWAKYENNLYWWTEWPSVMTRCYEILPTAMLGLLMSCIWFKRGSIVKIAKAHLKRGCSDTPICACLCYVSRGERYYRLGIVSRILALFGKYRTYITI